MANKSDATEEQIKVFISYADENRKMAATIKKGLEQLGFDCFLAHEDIPAGEWRDHIDDELELFEVFLPLLTDEAKESAWVQQESGIAHRRKRKGKNVSIIPLKRDYDPEGCLSIYQAHQLRSGFWGGLKFENKDVIELSKKFVEEIDTKDRARIHALKGLSYASADRADLILDFALWAGITLDDTKYIMLCTEKNTNMVYSDGIYYTVSKCYKHYEQFLKQEPQMVAYWQDYNKAVKQRRAEEERRRLEREAATARYFEQLSKQQEQKSAPQTPSVEKNQSNEGVK